MNSLPLVTHHLPVSARHEAAEHLAANPLTSEEATREELAAARATGRRAAVNCDGDARFVLLNTEDTGFFMLCGKARKIQGLTAKNCLLFHPRPAAAPASPAPAPAAAPASPVKFIPMPHLNAPGDSPAAPAPHLPIARADVVNYLRNVAATAPRGSASLKSAATILSTLPE